MTPSYAVQFGLSDQHAYDLADPLFAALRVDYVRLVVPWNVAITDPSAADEWLQTAAQQHLVPMVAFERASTDRCPDQPCSIPSLASYGDGFAAFRARWPEVHEFTAWNEPNHPNQPTEARPAQAAALYDELRNDCSSCLVVAGDMLDSAGMKTWFANYRSALKTTPQVWGLHNYGDTTYDRTSYTGWLAGTVSEPIWLTETGGIVHFTSGGQDVLPYDEDRAAESVRKALSIISAYPNSISRAYFYEWRADRLDSFDSGFLRPDGSSRPALAVFQRAVGRRPVAAAPPDRGIDQLSDPSKAGSATRDPEPSQDPAAPTPATTDGAAEAGPDSGPASVDRTARLVRTHHGLSLRVACPRIRGCRGRLTFTAAATVNGLRHVLGSATFSIPAGATRPVLVRVSAGARRRARLAGNTLIVAVLLFRRPNAVLEASWPLTPSGGPA